MSSKTFLTLIISSHLWEMKFGFWKTYLQELRGELNWDFTTHYHLLAGPTFPTTITRLVWLNSLHDTMAENLIVIYGGCDWHICNRIWKQILPLLQKYKVVHLNKTDTRLANNGLPLDIQKLRCRVNFNALRFTSQIEELGRRVVQILRQNGPFLVLHLRYEMDMLAFSGCTQGCTEDEAEELTRMRWPIFFWCWTSS